MIPALTTGRKSRQLRTRLSARSTGSKPVTRESARVTSRAKNPVSTSALSDVDIVIVSLRPVGMPSPRGRIARSNLAVLETQLPGHNQSGDLEQCRTRRESVRPEHCERVSDRAAELDAHHADGLVGHRVSTIEELVQLGVPCRAAGRLVDQLW